jgi:hypothetical protein
MANLRKRRLVRWIAEMLTAFSAGPLAVILIEALLRAVKRELMLFSGIAFGSFLILCGIRWINHRDKLPWAILRQSSRGAAE